MTRIGYCQIRTDTLTDNASYRRDNLAPLKISINTTVPLSLGYLAGVAKEIDIYAVNHKRAESTSFF